MKHMKESILSVNLHFPNCQHQEPLKQVKKEEENEEEPFQTVNKIEMKKWISFFKIPKVYDR